MFIFLGLGSNLCDRRHYLTEAVGLIEGSIGEITAQSSVIETEPWGYESANSYLNSAVLVHTSLEPQQVLTQTQSIEKSLGRTNKTTITNGRPEYSDRPIDIDLLMSFSDEVFHSTLTEIRSGLMPACTDLFLPDFPQGHLPDFPQDVIIIHLINNSDHLHTPSLILPHPHILQRDFVMKPILDILQQL